MVDDLIGIPFVDGGRSPSGYDCWGLAMEAARRFNHQLPEFHVRAHETFKIVHLMESQKQEADEGNSSRWIKLKDPEPGCLILMTNAIRGINHAGIYIGEGRFIHTLEGVSSHVSRLTEPMWKNRIKGFYKYVG